MTDSGTETKLTGKQEAFIAFYLGDARQNATEAARLAGYAGNDKTLGVVGCENLAKPKIAAAIQQWRDAVRQQGIASLEYRVNRLDELERKYFDLIAARRAAYGKDADVIGGDTGLVIKQYKMVGGGENAMLVEEYVADVAVSREIRAIYDDVAKELGQRVDKINVSGNLTREYVIVRPGEEPGGEAES